MEDEEDSQPPNCKLLTEVGGLTFSSCFDSGNLVKVQFEANEYRLWIGPDCAGTPHETSYTTWFHFSMQGGKKGQVASLTIMNSNPLKGLYGSDMRPVYRCGATKNRWERLLSPLKAKMHGELMRLSFRFRFEDDNDTVFFAFCYPWSYQECQSQLAGLDAEYGPPARHPGIYYHRELLTRSVEGRRIDLLTISSRDMMRPERDAAVKDTHVFPERGPSGEGAPFAFDACKKVVFVSARVHPGETPASFVFNGLLSFLLKEDDPRARQLRRQFVFKLVPMLNPDGVARGHYRLDTQGLNLNRHYINPSPTEHPAIYAVRSLVLGLHDRASLILYLDLHAHAAKKGCFFYGNQFERHQLDKQVATQLFARLAGLNSPFLEYGQCVFTEKNMKRKDKRDKDLSKEGAGRVALYRATGLTYFYTLECNYNEGTRITAALRTGAFSTSMRKGTPPSQLDRPPRSSAYTAESWENVGQGVAITLLAMAGTNPVTRPVSSNTPPLGAPGRTQRRSAFDPGSELSGNVDEVYRALREQVLLTGSFEDQLPASSWASATDEWRWEGPLSPPSTSPEDDAASSADRSLPPAAPPSASSSTRGAKPSPRAAAATASSAAREKLRRERDDASRRSREGRPLILKTPFLSGPPQPQYKLQPSHDLALRLPVAKAHVGPTTSTAAARRSAIEATSAQRHQPGPVAPGGSTAAAASLRGRTKSLSSAIRSLRLSTPEEARQGVQDRRSQFEMAPRSGTK